MLSINFLKKCFTSAEQARVDHPALDMPCALPVRALPFETKRPGRDNPPGRFCLLATEVRGLTPGQPGMRYCTTFAPEAGAGAAAGAPPVAAISFDAPPFLSSGICTVRTTPLPSGKSANALRARYGMARTSEDSAPELRAVTL